MSRSSRLGDNIGMKHRFFLIVLLLGSLVGTAESRQIGRYKSLTASITDTFTCGEKVKLTVTAPDESYFKGDRIALQRLVGSTRAALGFECDRIRSILIYGNVGAKKVYQGISAAAGNWAVVDMTPKKVESVTKVPQPHSSKSKKNQVVPDPAAKCLKGDCYNGFGTYIYPNGAEYVGQFKDGKKHGNGTISRGKADKYIGGFKDDKHHGQGTISLPDGSKYIGEWKNGSRTGKGTHILPSGKKYIGDFKDGKMNGGITVVLTGGKKFIGRFDNGKQIGEWENAAYVKNISNKDTAKSLPGQRAVKKAQGLNAKSLNTLNLNYETELTGVYLGDFKHARLSADGVPVSMIFRHYLEAFGRHCKHCLPANKVPITVSECATESVTRDGWGYEISRTCVEWRDVPTGLYADAALYASSNRVSHAAGMNMLSESMGEGDLLAGRGAVDDKLSLGNDMEKLVLQNGCKSDALKRFEQNLYRFVEGKPPLKLAGNETLASTRKINKAALHSNNLNFKQLLNELIIENSRGWMINRYMRGSVGRIRVQSRNSDGSPRKVFANYSYNTMGQISSGSVTLIFSNGIPKCLYFFDAPRNCRHPSRRIITAYEKGKYSNK